MSRKKKKRNKKKKQNLRINKPQSPNISESVSEQQTTEIPETQSLFEEESAGMSESQSLFEEEPAGMSESQSLFEEESAGASESQLLFEKQIVKSSELQQDLAQGTFVQRKKRLVRRSPKNLTLVKGLIERRQPAEEKKEDLPHEAERSLFGYVRFLVFPCAIMFEEAVLHISTQGGYAGASFFVTLLFSIAFGLLLHSLCILIKNQKARHRVMLGLTVLTAVVFMIFYFTYMQFKMFYDLNTIFFAGGDAAGGFTGEIVRMVTSAEGIIHIILFLLPPMLYFLCTRRLLKSKANLYPAYSRRKKVICFALTAGAFIIGIIITHVNPALNTAYTKNYNFSTVVSKFGLLTGIRRDAVRMITGEDKQVSFSAGVEEKDAGTGMADGTQTSVGQNGTKTRVSGSYATENETGSNTKSSVTTNSRPADTTVMNEKSGTQEATKPVVYGDNVLDIDFAKMAEKSTGNFATIDKYVSTLKPTKQNEYTGLFKGKNLIFITMESFSGFPIDKELFPTLYKMQHEGFYFPNYFIPYVAVTTGSEYSLLKGILPMAGAASMVNTSSFHNYMTIGSFLTREGYYGQMFHNGDVWYYDRNITHNKLGYTEPYMAYHGGLDELIENPYPRRDEDMAKVTLPFYAHKEPFNIYYITMSGHSPYDIYNNPYAEPAKPDRAGESGTDKIVADNNHASAGGSESSASVASTAKIGDTGEYESFLSAATGSTNANADTSTDTNKGISIDTNTDIGKIADASTDKTAAANDYNADKVSKSIPDPQEILKEKGYTPIIETYLIYQMEVEKMVKALIEGLDQAGVLEDTVIVMTGDHYPYGVYDGTGYRKLLGELYGYEIVNDFDRDRNNLIIWTPSLAKKEPVTSKEPVSALDVLPTLLNLFGLPYDSRLLPGRDVFSGTDALVFDANYNWRTTRGTYLTSTGTFTPAAGVSEEEIPEEYVDKISAIVKNKIEYCRSLTYNDYYYHVFGDEYPGAKQEKKEKQIMDRAD